MVKVNENKPEDVNVFGPQSSLSSDGSFVVLERSPPQEPSGQYTSTPQPSLVCSSFPPNNSFPGGVEPGNQNQNSSYVPGSIPSDLSPEEIQRKLHDVLQENLELKETLQQNNLAMKQQFNTLVMWQEEVYKVHQSHKAKFAETKELILKLRAENAELKSIVEEYKNAGSNIPSAAETELKMENVELKGKIAELQQKLSAPVPRKEQMHGGPSKKEQELSSLLEQVNRQLEAAERAKRQLIVDVERLTAQRTRLEHDLKTQKTEMEEHKVQLLESEKAKEYLEEKIKDLSQRLELAEYTLLESSQQQHNSHLPSRGLQPSAQEFQRLIAQLDEQRALVNTLTYQLKEEKLKVEAARTAAGSSVNEQAILATHDLRGCEEKLEHFNSCLGKESERFVSLDRWLQEASDSMNQWKGTQSVDMKTVNILKAEIQELRKLLAEEKANSEEKKNCMEEAQKKFQDLFSDYQALLRELETVNKKDQQNSAYLEVQARGFTEKIDNMTAQLLNKDEALAEKDKQLKEMKDIIQKAELTNEAMTILKAQVEVYQSDFNAEREARENLAGEKERLAEDLRHLQRRNQQLLDELETYQQNQFEQIQRQGPPAHVPSAPTLAGKWGTVPTPGRVQNMENRNRVSPPNKGRPSTPNRRSPGRPSPGPEQPQPLHPPVEKEDSPVRVYDDEIPPPKRYFCPVCNMEFAQLNVLEYHLETCLEGP